MRLFSSAHNGKLRGAAITSNPQFANERAIIVARVPLAIGALLATYIDPSQPERPETSYALLLAYVTFSLLLLATYSRPRSNVWNMSTHIVEVMLLCAIITSTEGPYSPFFIYFSFAVLAAALRWQWAGALITGGALSVILIIMAWTAVLVRVNDAEVYGLIIRNVYLIVVTVLFAFLGNQFYKSSKQAERLELAQNLHDGLLQSLSAIRLKLGTALSTTVDVQLASEAARLLAQEQQQIRTFVSDIRDPQLGPLAHIDLASALRSRIENSKRLWGCHITSDVQHVQETVSIRFARAIELILSEAVANAVLHGGAKQLDVVARSEAGALFLRITDDGKGLANPAGAYDHKQMRQTGAGPRSIGDRVDALGGRLTLINSPLGATLELSVPIAENH